MNAIFYGKRKIHYVASTEILYWALDIKNALESSSHFRIEWINIDDIVEICANESIYYASAFREWILEADSKLQKKHKISAKAPRTRTESQPAPQDVKEIAADMQVFNCHLGEIRVFIQDNEPFFLALDLCHILEYKNGRDTIRRLFPKGVAKYYTHTNGGKQRLSYLDEKQMYKLIMESKAKCAEEFQDWVCDEVLPAIRKTNAISNLPVPKQTICEDKAMSFNFNTLQVDVMFENGVPYFKLTDIERVLELTKGQSAKWVKDGWFDDDEIKLRKTQLGGYPLKYVAESGLYRILNKSNSAKAKPFERWVTKEVLPTIRKTGSYSIAPQIDYSNPVSVLEALKESVEKQILLHKENETLKIENNEQRTLIEYQEDKLDNYTKLEKTRRSKAEISVALNKTIKKLAEQKFSSNYSEAYNYIYKIFAGTHCIKEPITMDYLRKNVGYLSECLSIATSELR